MTDQEANVVVESMTVLPFFDKLEPAARGLVADELVRMCPTVEQGMWLVRRMAKLYGKWPGLEEMRAAYCSKFMPRDGIECCSAVYPEGIPSEKESYLPSYDQKAVPGLALKLLAEAAQSLPADAAPLVLRERIDTREAERQIAEAKPTLSAAEKQRRLDEIKAAMKP